MFRSANPPNAAFVIVCSFARVVSRPQPGRDRRTILAPPGLEPTNDQEQNMRAGCPPGTRPDDTRIGTHVDRRAAA
ncbi:hypothetical protein BURMUCGD2M_6461 [Burkholderia multivorans CGD2M]|uniref:Uncharacterized protein n=1 Tax=Burkholderia multivorans CGD2 TaxID=513052 RepID=B9BP50_9BURK|nr:hypothetical protein BURMUCGD2_6471 [Burkholderia multivorans CGD2]EEE13739.1 hypothetical protein BURMUCGD2M_6461 [Burkholderia multivorans CGD2M]PRH30420.1 hypothetical protein C6T53_06405 [Burkholderia multivorans]